MLAHSHAKLIICLDEREHCIIIWTRIFCVHVLLYTPTGAETSVGEFLDEFRLEQFGWGCRLYDLA